MLESVLIECPACLSKWRVFIGVSTLYCPYCGYKVNRKAGSLWQRFKTELRISKNELVGVALLSAAIFVLCLAGADCEGKARVRERPTAVGSSRIYPSNPKPPKESWDYSSDEPQ